MFKFSQVKTGDIVYENELGFSDEYRAETDATRYNDEGWQFDAVNTATNETVHFYAADGFEYYCMLDTVPHYQVVQPRN